jgi:hypothetical protein
VIENLDITSGRPPYTFTGRNGVTPYAENCSAIYVEKGQHVLIRGCTFRDCGNGFFCASQTADLVLESNTIAGNGIEGSIYEHNNYTEAFGILFQFNHFAPLRDGCPGNNLKDRSAGTIIRYNWIESGNRQLDLVDSDYPELYNDPSYRRTFVYGNILIEPEGAGNSQILHYGGDSGNSDHYRKGTLFLYNNTIVSTRSGNTTLARLSTDDETCDARNNILYVSASGDHLAMLAESGGVIDLWRNWLKPGWVASHSGGSGRVIDHGNIEGSDPGFVDFAAQAFELSGNSACIDAGNPLLPDVPPDRLPEMEYVRHAMSRPRPADGAFDIGAYEHASLDAVPGEPAPIAALRAYPNPVAPDQPVTLECRAGARILAASAGGRLWLDFTPGRANPAVRVVDAGGEGRPCRIEWRPPAGAPAGVYFLSAEGPGGRARVHVLRLR